MLSHLAHLGHNNVPKEIFFSWSPMHTVQLKTVDCWNHNYHSTIKATTSNDHRVLTKILKTGAIESIPGKVGVKIEKQEFDLEKLEL